MNVQTSFHASKGQEFLGMRLSRRGEVEVVYDGGASNRRVWRVVADGHGAAHLSSGEEQALSESLRIAAQAPRVLTALYDELKKRALQLEIA
jgi:hypothetical protein